MPNPIGLFDSDLSNDDWFGESILAWFDPDLLQSASGSTTNVNLSFNATGSASMSKLFVVVKSFSFSGTGSVSLAQSALFKLSLSAVAVGSASVVKKIIMAARSFSAIGSASVVKRISMSRAFTALGSVAYSDTLSLALVFSYVATGAANMTKNVIFGGGGAVRRAVWAIKARLSRLL